MIMMDRNKVLHLERFGIIANTSKLREIKPVLIDFCEYLNNKNVKVALENSICDKIPELASNIHVSHRELLDFSQVIITIGGDGTILNAVHLISDKEIFILGFHMGELGFLAELSRFDFKDKMDQILAGRVRLDSRMVLHSEIRNGKNCTCEFALNDFVLFKGLSPRMMTLTVEIDGFFMNTYQADGLIISSPTGSTAYSLSSSGPILMPDVPAIIINPICPHTLSQRPMVIDANRLIRITFKQIPQGAYLTADGQHVEKLSRKAEILIKKADHSVQLIRCEDYSYFDVLRHKLNWGKR